MPYIIGELGYTLNTCFFIIPETERDEMGVKKDALITQIFSAGYNTRDWSSHIQESLKFSIPLYVPQQPETINDILESSGNSIDRVSIIRSFKDKAMKFTVFTKNGKRYESTATGMEYQGRILK